MNGIEQVDKNVQPEDKESAETFSKFKREFEGTISTFEALLFRLKERQEAGYVDFIDEDHGGRLTNAVEEAKRLDIESPESVDAAVLVLEEIAKCVESIQMYPPERGMIDDPDNLLYFSWDLNAIAEAATRVEFVATGLDGLEGGRSSRLLQISSALKESAEEKKTYIAQKAEALSAYNR